MKRTKSVQSTQIPFFFHFSAASHFFLHILLFSGFFSFSQSSFLPLEHNVVSGYERMTSAKNSGFHSSVKPFLHSDLKKWIDVDSVENSKNLFKKFSKKDNETTNSKQQTNNYIEASPVFFLHTGYEKSDTVERRVEGTAIGASLNIKAGEKLYINANYFSANSAYPAFISHYIDSMKIVPSEGYRHKTDMGYHFKNSSGYISYSPSQIFNFQLGHGKNFFGDGYRSLLLSDAANNYSFFKITTTAWKIKYVNLFANFKDVRGTYSDYWHFKDKYGTFHYLSWNATRWLNIGIFESVIWQGKDTLETRGFDVNYMNPVIFYRPVEYSVGSPDNSLMGLNMKVKITNSLQFYSQVIIDEFLLKEIKARSGWWANKYGGQAGLKYFNAFGLKGFSLQTEFNAVRPYTYTHGSVMQNYAHFNQPLAHPLGANFYEVLGIINFEKKRFFIEGKSNVSKFGADPRGKNFGGNIYKSYTRIPQNYGNKIGQGDARYLLITELKTAYMIYPKLNLRVEIGVLYRLKYAYGVLNANSYIWVGLRTSLYNVYRDFM